MALAKQRISLDQDGRVVSNIKACSIHSLRVSLRSSRPLHQAARQRTSRVTASAQQHKLDVVTLGNMARMAPRVRFLGLGPEACCSDASMSDQALRVSAIKQMREELASLSIEAPEPDSWQCDIMRAGAGTPAEMEAQHSGVQMICLSLPDEQNCKAVSEQIRYALESHAFKAKLLADVEARRAKAKAATAAAATSTGPPFKPGGSAGPPTSEPGSSAAPPTSEPSNSAGPLTCEFTPAVSTAAASPYSPEMVEGLVEAMAKQHVFTKALAEKVEDLTANLSEAREQLSVYPPIHLSLLAEKGTWICIEVLELPDAVLNVAFKQPAKPKPWELLELVDRNTCNRGKYQKQLDAEGFSKEVLQVMANRSRKLDGRHGLVHWAPLTELPLTTREQVQADKAAMGVELRAVEQASGQAVTGLKRLYSAVYKS